MKRAQIIVPGPVGLHARPAADFVHVAERFKSKVRLGKDGVWVNGKSILQILSLAAEAGCKVILEVSGSDEDDAFPALVAQLRKSET